MWRFVLLLSVLFFLALAYFEYFWRFRFLKAVFIFFGFDGPRASASEQTAHYLAGMTIFAFLNLLSQIFLDRPVVVDPSWYIYVSAAVSIGVEKECAEFVLSRFRRSRKWSFRDSLADVFFWFLGGLTAPLLKMYL